MTLHLVRGAAPPAAVVEDGDRVLHASGGAWTDAEGAPVSDEQLVALVFACARVVVW